MASSSEEEMEKLEDYFSDIDVLNVSVSEMEIHMYFTLNMQIIYVFYNENLNNVTIYLCIKQDTLE